MASPPNVPVDAVVLTQGAAEPAITPAACQPPKCPGEGAIGEGLVTASPLPPKPTREVQPSPSPQPLPAMPAACASPAAAELGGKEGEQQQQQREPTVSPAGALPEPCKAAMRTAKVGSNSGDICSVSNMHLASLSPATAGTGAQRVADAVSSPAICGEKVTSGAVCAVAVDAPSCSFPGLQSEPASSAPVGGQRDGQAQAGAPLLVSEPGDEETVIVPETGSDALANFSLGLLGEQPQAGGAPQAAAPARAEPASVDPVDECEGAAGMNATSVDGTSVGAAPCTSLLPALRSNNGDSASTVTLPEASQQPQLQSDAEPVAPDAPKDERSVQPQAAPCAPDAVMDIAPAPVSRSTAQQSSLSMDVQELDTVLDCPPPRSSDDSGPGAEQPVAAADGPAAQQDAAAARTASWNSDEQAGAEQSMSQADSPAAQQEDAAARTASWNSDQQAGALLSTETDAGPTQRVNSSPLRNSAAFGGIQEAAGSQPPPAQLAGIATSLDVAPVPASLIAAIASSMHSVPKSTAGAVASNLGATVPGSTSVVTPCVAAHDPSACAPLNNPSRSGDVPKIRAADELQSAIGTHGDVPKAVPAILHSSTAAAHVRPSGVSHDRRMAAKTADAAGCGSVASYAAGIAPNQPAATVTAAGQGGFNACSDAPPATPIEQQCDPGARQRLILEQILAAGRGLQTPFPSITGQMTTAAAASRAMHTKVPHANFQAVPGTTTAALQGPMAPGISGASSQGLQPLTAHLAILLSSKGSKQPQQLAGASTAGGPLPIPKPQVPMHYYAQASRAPLQGNVASTACQPTAVQRLQQWHQDQEAVKRRRLNDHHSVPIAPAAATTPFNWQARTTPMNQRSLPPHGAYPMAHVATTPSALQARSTPMNQRSLPSHGAYPIPSAGQRAASAFQTPPAARFEAADPLSPSPGPSPSPAPEKALPAGVMTLKEAIAAALKSPDRVRAVAHLHMQKLSRLLRCMAFLCSVPVSVFSMRSPFMTH